MNAIQKIGRAIFVAALAASAGVAAPSVWAAGDAPKSKPAENARAAKPKLGDYLAARAAQLDHDWRAAGALMRSAWEADRDDPELRRGALLFSVAGGNFAAAAAVAHAVPAGEGDGPLANLVLVVEAFTAGQYGQAETILASVPAQGANRYLVPLLTAWSEVGKGRAAAATAALKPLSDLKGASELHDLQAAMVAEATGDSAGATAAYNGIAAGNPSTQALFLAAQFYQRQGAFERAQAMMEKLDPDGQSGPRRTAAMAKISAKVRAGVTPDPRIGAAAAFFEIGASLGQQNDQEGLLDSTLYDQLALHLRPNFPDAELLLAEIYEHLGRVADAVPVLLAIDPTSDLRSTAEHEAMLDLARIKQADEAIKVGRAGTEAHPNDFSLALDYGDLLREKQRYADAVAVYSGVLARLPPTSIRRGLALFGRGAAYERAQDWPHAEADLLAALMLRPSDPELLNYLAFAWADRGINLDRAHTMLERAIQLSPNNGAFIDSLGWVMFRQGAYDEAVKQLERAVELDADDATVADHLGDAYWRAGRQIEARVQWERAARLTDDKALAEQIRAKLRDGLAPVAPRRAAAD